ncbi:MAG: spore germination protein [Clostridiales bacterium]|nr:spore germination protein [Clostridiales bacterium]
MFKAKRKENTTFSETPDNKQIDLTSDNLREILGKSADIQFIDIYICGDRGRPVTVAFVDGMADQKSISDFIIKPLMEKSMLYREKADTEVVDLIAHGLVRYPVSAIYTDINGVINDILSGCCAVIFDIVKTAVTFCVREMKQRNVAEPTNETAAKGAKDCFVESLSINTATVRSKIKTQRLVIEETTVGRQTLTNIGIVYLDGTVNQTLVDEVKRRLSGIEIDGVIEPGFVEEYIIDKKFTAFPQVLATERPDKFCTAILEGRVGLLIDGIPFAYDVPAVLYNFLRTVDDYSQNFWLATVLRILRYLCLMLTLVLPAFYVAITTFHQEMIPTELALSIVSSREGVPFPTFLEVILLQIAFEIILEAGLRLPRSIGQTISIVGALVVGEAAVNARLISPAVVVIVALTVISGLAIPTQDFANAVRLWRFILILFSSFIGLFGIGVGALLLLFDLCSIETFGVPYIAPFATNEGQNMDDSIIRMPLSFIKKRPAYMNSPNERRQK